MWEGWVNFFVLSLVSAVCLCFVGYILTEVAAPTRVVYLFFFTTCVTLLGWFNHGEKARIGTGLGLEVGDGYSLGFGWSKGQRRRDGA